jgi:hypothetical protein
MHEAGTAAQVRTQLEETGLPVGAIDGNPA